MSRTPGRKSKKPRARAEKTPVSSQTLQDLDGSTGARRVHYFGFDEGLIRDPFGRAFVIAKFGRDLRGRRVPGRPVFHGRVSPGVLASVFERSQAPAGGAPEGNDGASGR